jgi:hypothetical protein
MKLYRISIIIIFIYTDNIDGYFIMLISKFVYKKFEGFAFTDLLSSITIYCTRSIG